MEIKKALKENSFLLMLGLIFIFSMIVPKPGEFIQQKGLLSPMTFIAMFTAGLGLPISKIKGSFRDYKSILYSIASIFFIFPAVTYILLRLFNIHDGDVFVGAMILAVQASTLSSAVVLTIAANGNVSLALIITIISNSVSAFLSPVLLRFILALQDSITFDIGDMIIRLVIVLILPVVLAQFVRQYFKKVLEIINPYRQFISKFVVLTFVLTGASLAGPQISKHMSNVVYVVVFVTVLHLIMLLITALYSKGVKLPEDSKIAVLFCSTQKTLPATLMVWSVYFSQYALASAVIIFYHIVQLFIDSAVVNYFNRKRVSNK